MQTIDQRPGCTRQGVVTGLPIPQQWEDITPAWMTAAISGQHPGAEVDTVSLLLRDDGTNRRARFGLTYRAGSGPATVFAKAEDPAHREIHISNGNIFNETRLFRSDVLLPIDKPLIYAALIDEPGYDYLIVMEDLKARGADPRDATRPLTLEQAASGVRNLARLHSEYWNKVSSYPELNWVKPFFAWTRLGSKIPAALELAGDTIPAEVRNLSREQIVENYWARYINAICREPQTLLHGDTHIGNTYVLPNNDVGFLDWQVTRRGNWSIDLGYFLQGALTIEDRRQGEAELVEVYRQALQIADEQRPGAEEAWLWYRASAAYGLAIWLATLSADGWQARDVALALVQRYAAAFVELDTPAALDLIGC